MGIKINISYKTFSHYSLSVTRFCFTCVILCNKHDDDDDDDEYNILKKTKLDLIERKYDCHCQQRTSKYGPL